MAWSPMGNSIFSFRSDRSTDDGSDPFVLSCTATSEHRNPRPPDFCTGSKFPVCARTFCTGLFIEADRQPGKDTNALACENPQLA